MTTRTYRKPDTPELVLLWDDTIVQACTLAESWDDFESVSANAHTMLKEADLDPAGSRDGVCFVFEQRFGPKPRTVEVGSIFSASWGYDQTNVDFYEVVGFTPSRKSVRLRKIAGSISESGNMSGTIKPVPGEYRGETFTKRLGGNSYNATPSVRINSYTYAFLMKDPTAEQYVSWYA